VRAQAILAAVASLALVGCATAPPNTPGAGSGDTYTPFIDLQGVDPGRYSSDLAGCRSYAQQIDPNKETVQGILAGALVGAIVGASVGGSSRYSSYGANYGATVGGISSGGRAIFKQETVIANCMAGRGYRVLEGATIGTNTSAPSPYTYGAAPNAIPGTGYVSNYGVIQPGVTQVAQAQPNGQDSFTVEKLVRETTCNADPVAQLAAKGPGYETYTVSCTSGDSWMYRCEFGNCRKLQ
jgi:outer membrane lipoprotein SlyB